MEESFSEIITREGTTVHFPKGKLIFSQGDAADAVYSVQKGKVKLSVVSKRGKTAVIAILASGDLNRRRVPGRPPTEA